MEHDSADMSWTEAEKRLVFWRVRALHYSAARAALRRHYAIGIPCVGLSAALATLGFVGVAGKVSIGVTLGVAVSGSLATVLTALQAFLNFGARARDHQQAGVRYGNIARDIEALLALPSTVRGNVAFGLPRFSERPGHAADESPVLPDALIERHTRTRRVGTAEGWYPWDPDHPASPDAAA